MPAGRPGGIMKHIKFLLLSLFFFLSVSLVSVHAAVNDGITDYSNLKPDEDGDYWIYFEFNSDDFHYKNDDVSHSAHLQYWVKINNYEQTGHPGIWFEPVEYSNDLSLKYYNFSVKKYTSYTSTVHVKGDYDGETYDITLPACLLSSLLKPDFLFKEVSSGAAKIISPDYMDCFLYLPVPEVQYEQYKDPVVLNFEYVQDKPNKKLPAPQVPVFEYEYINGRISGLVCCFRYPVDTVEHFYELVDKGKRSGSSHSSTVDGSSYYKKTPYVYSASDTGNEYAGMSTYLDYRVTFMIGSNSYTTGWARLGVFGYADTKYNQYQVTNPTWWFFDVYNQYDVLIRDWKNNSEIWQCMLRLDKLPDIIKDSGYVSFSDTDSIILTKIEVSAYNVLQRGARSLTSDMVYGQFDCITNTFSGSVLPDSSPEIVAGDNGDITINVNIDIDTVIPSTPDTSVSTGNTDVVPGISGDGSSSGGSSGFFDSISGLFDLVLKVFDLVLTGLVRLGRLFFSLIGDIIDMCGEFPKLFGFIVDAFPQEFMTLMMIGFAAALVLKIFGR